MPCNSVRDACAQLLASDETLRALLLERVRPGIPLAQQPDDEVNTRIAARVMLKYCQPAPTDHGLATVKDRITALDRLRQRFDGGTGPVPEVWVSRAEEAFVELTATSEGDVVLHGDLHHWNILSAQRQSKRVSSAYRQLSNQRPVHWPVSAARRAAPSSNLAHLWRANFRARSAGVSPS